jgi:hypothetical protein
MMHKLCKHYRDFLCDNKFTYYRSELYQYLNVEKETKQKYAHNSCYLSYFICR